MLDMVTALEWVHNNIAYFGGNPNEITIFGESAGSATIGHMLLSSETNGLFARGIGSSGSPLATWAFDTEPEMHARYGIVLINMNVTLCKKNYFVKINKIMCFYQVNC